MTFVEYLRLEQWKEYATVVDLDKMMQREYSLENVGFDTSENEPSKVP